MNTDHPNYPIIQNLKHKAAALGANKGIDSTPQEAFEIDAQINELYQQIKYLDPEEYRMICPEDHDWIDIKISPPLESKEYHVCIEVITPFGSSIKQKIAYYNMTTKKWSTTHNSVETNVEVTHYCNIKDNPKI